MNNLSPEQLRKLDSIVNEGIATKERIKLERDSLNDAIKALAEEFDVKPKAIRKVITIASKMNFDEEQEEFDTISEILRQTGRAA